MVTANNICYGNASITPFLFFFKRSPGSDLFPNVYLQLLWQRKKQKRDVEQRQEYNSCRIIELAVHLDKVDILSNTTFRFVIPSPPHMYPGITMLHQHFPDNVERGPSKCRMKDS